MNVYSLSLKAGGGTTKKKIIKIIIIIYNNNNDNNKIKCENKLINYMGNTFVDNFYLEKYINTK